MVVDHSIRFWIVQKMPSIRPNLLVRTLGKESCTNQTFSTLHYQMDPWASSETFKNLKITYIEKNCYLRSIYMFERHGG